MIMRYAVPSHYSITDRDQTRLYVMMTRAADLASDGNPDPTIKECYDYAQTLLTEYDEARERYDVILGAYLDTGLETDDMTRDQIARLSGVRRAYHQIAEGAVTATWGWELLSI